MTRHREDPPPRYGICQECKMLVQVFGTGNKSVTRHRVMSGYPGAGCRGVVHLPGDKAVQTSADAAYRIGGPEAARPIIETYWGDPY